MASVPSGCRRLRVARGSAVPTIVAGLLHASGSLDAVAVQDAAESIPCDVPRQSLGERRRRGVAQLGRGPADVGVGLPDVARLLGQPPDDRRLAQRRADRVDEPPQLDRVGVPQVVEVMAPAAVDGPDDPVDDVGDEGVVAPGGAVAEHRHRLAAVDQPGELARWPGRGGCAGHRR